MPHSRSLTTDTLLRAPTAIRKLFAALLILIAMAVLAATGRAQTFPDVRWMRAGQGFGASSAAQDAFSHDGAYIAVAYFREPLYLYRASDGMLLHQFPLSADNNSVAFAADGSLLVLDPTSVTIGSQIYNLVTRYSTTTYQTLASYYVSASRGGGMVMEPNGSHLLINGALFRDSDLSAPLLAATAGSGFVGFSFPTTGQVFYGDSNGDAPVMSFVDPPFSSQNILTYNHGSDQWNYVISVSPNDLYYLGRGGPNSFVDANSDTGVNSPVPLTFPNGPNAWWSYSQWTPDGASIFAQASSGTFGAFSGSPPFSSLWYQTGFDAVYATPISDDSTRVGILPEGLDWNTLPGEILNLADGSLNTRLNWMKTGGWDVWRSSPFPVLSPDGTCVATLTSKNDINTWNVATGELVGQIPQPDRAANCGAFLDDDTLIVGHGIITGNNYLEAYTTQGQLLWQNTSLTNVSAVAISKGVGYASTSAAIVTFNPKTGQQTGSIVDVTSVGTPVQIAPSPDGMKLAFFAYGTIFVTDIHGNAISQYQSDFYYGIKQISWSGDSKKLAESGRDALYPVYVIDTTTGTHTGVGAPDVTGSYSMACFAPRSNYVVYWSGPGHLGFVDSTTGNEIIGYTHFQGNTPWGIYYAPNEQTVVLFTDDGTISTINNPLWLPAALSKVSTSPASLAGGAACTGTVALNCPAAIGGAPVSLSVANPPDIPNLVAVPSSVTVAEGLPSATFTVTTIPVATPHTATISASYGYPGYRVVTKTCKVNVLPPALSSIKLSKASVTGGTSVTGTVTLSGLTAVDTVVNLACSNTTVATLPDGMGTDSVTVPAGQKSATFTVTTIPDAANTTASISASYAPSGGVLVTKTANLTINTPTLSALKLSATSVKGGAPVTGTVTLSGPAPANGTSAALSSANPAATVPASVTVPAGQKSATFTVTTVSPGTTNAVGAISATTGTTTKSVTLTVKP